MMYAAALAREKAAHYASTQELATYCPAVADRLWKLHQQFCDRLDKMLAEARSFELEDQEDDGSAAALNLVSLLTSYSHDPDSTNDYYVYRVLVEDPDAERWVDSTP
jgi:hypothetical protein